MYRSYTYNGQVTDRIDFTEGEFTTPVEVSIAEVAAALGVSVDLVTSEDSDVVPEVRVIIPPTLVKDTPVAETDVFAIQQAVDISTLRSAILDWIKQNGG